MELQLNGKPVINAEIAGVNFADYPDFSDAYFNNATFEDGTDLSDEELFALDAQYASEYAFEITSGGE